MKTLIALVLGLLPMAVFAAPAGAPLDVTASRLEVDQNNGHAVFSGNVRAVRGNLTLTSARADIAYGTTSGGDVKDVTATGSVVITRKNADGTPDVATGEKAVYTPATGKLVMTGGTVLLTRGGRTVQGTRLDYDTVAGQAVMQGGSGGVHAHFQSGAK